MRAAQLICGAVSFGVAGILALHLAQAFQPVILPGLQQLGKEETTYFVVKVAGFTLRGSQVLRFEGALGLLFLVAMAAGIYAFKVSPTDA